MNRLDWFLLALFVLLTLLHGVYFGKRQKNLGEFYYASGGFSWFPVGLSLMITAFSAINLVAFSGEIVRNGSYVVLSLPLLPLVALWVLRYFLPHEDWQKGDSLFALLERKRSVRLRQLAALIFVIWKLLWIALVVYVPSRLLASLSGLPLALFVLLTVVVVTAYTLAGGLRAVIWSDLLQALLVLGALVWTLVHVLNRSAESPSQLLSLAYEGGLFRPFAPFSLDMFSPDPTLRITLWSSWLGSTVIFLSRYVADQSAIQRYRAMGDGRQRRRAVHLSYISSLFMLLVVGTMALLINHYIVTQFQARDLSPLLLLSRFLSSLPPGLTGLMIVAVLAATFSSVDSGLHALTQIWHEDLSRRSSRTVGSVRLEVVYMGGGAGFLALILPYLGTVFEIVVSLVNALGGPLLGILLPVLFGWRLSERGLFWGGILALVTTIILGSGRLVSLHYVGLIGMLMPMFAASIGAKSRHVSEDS